MTTSKHKCDVCDSNRGDIGYNKDTQMYLCYKHQQQYIHHGKFLDNNSRTINDLNEIIDDEEDDRYSYIILYNSLSNPIAKTKINKCNVNKVKNIKWRITKKRNKQYVVSGKGSSQIYLARYILDYNGELEVDHINGDELNNTVENLRKVTRQENIINTKPKYTNKYGIRGIYKCKSKTQPYQVDFVYLKNRFYLKQFVTLEEAVYARYLLEINFCKEFRNTSSDKIMMQQIDKLSNEQKDNIKSYIHQKIIEKGLTYDN